MHTAELAAERLRLEENDQKREKERNLHRNKKAEGSDGTNLRICNWYFSCTCKVVRPDFKGNNFWLCYQAVWVWEGNHCSSTTINPDVSTLETQELWARSFPVPFLKSVPGPKPCQSWVPYKVASTLPCDFTSLALKQRRQEVHGCAAEIRTFWVNYVYSRTYKCSVSLMSACNSNNSL